MRLSFLRRPLENLVHHVLDTTRGAHANADAQIGEQSKQVAEKIIFMIFVGVMMWQVIIPAIQLLLAFKRG